MFDNIIIILLAITVLVFYYSTRQKEGFASQFPAQFDALNKDAGKKYNEVSNTLNLINPVIPLTSTNSNTVKAALNTVDMTPTSGSYNVKAPRAKYDIPNKIPSTIETAKKCEVAPATCSAFDDPTFAENCGMSFDIEGTNSDGKISAGGLYIAPDSRDEQMSNSAKARELHQDPYQVFQPTIGTAKPGKFALTKDDCIIVKERVDCESKQNFDSPNCTQCYTSRTFSRVGPDVARIPFKIILTGKGSCDIRSNNSEITAIIRKMQDARKHYGGFTFDDKNKSFEFEFPGNLEGTEFYIISTDMSNDAGVVMKASISGLIRGNTAKGSFSMDISHIVQVDRATGVKPRISGTTKLDGFNVVRMIPGKGQYATLLSCLIPFSFMDTNEYETGSCDNGPVITQANSAIFLNSDACFNKKNKPGDYNLECLQSRWMSMGGTSEGTGYPSTKEKADALQKTSDGSPLTLEAIIDNLTIIMLQAQTGRNANGQQLSMEDWNKASMFATGKSISSPCDVDDATTGPLSKECLSYLYMNQGTTSHIGATYDLPTWTTANLVGQPVRQTYCQPGAGMDPNTEAGLKLGQSLGGVEQVKEYYNRINRIANDNSLSNVDRENEIKQCYGVSLNPVVDNATPGPEQVFAVGPNYDYTRDQAASICAGYGAKVATRAQLEEAQTKGADWCFSAWVQDSPTGQWPITTSVKDGCGGKQGIIEWTDPTNKAGVNCYGPKPAIQSVSTGVIKPFNDTNWDQPSKPVYTEIPTGYLETSGDSPSCFDRLTPEQAKEGCDRLGTRCAGFSYSKDGLGSGCYKGNHAAGMNTNPAYMGFVKTPLLGNAGKVVGQYIVLKYDHQEYLNLAEIRVYSKKGGPNIITPRTRVYKPSNWGADIFPTRNFVDSNTNNFVHTSGGEVPWITVDFGAMTDIYKVVLFNRTDCCQSRVLGTVLQIVDRDGNIMYVSNKITTTNMIYTFYPPNPSVNVDQQDDAPYTSLGCWADTGNRAVPQIDGSDPAISGNYQQRANAINECYNIAKERGMKIFAVQDGGWCAADNNLTSYTKYGTSGNCRNGKGGPWANDVYKINS